MKEFLQKIETFVSLQIGLWNELNRDIQHIDILLLNIPKKGSLKFEGNIWTYTKHGLGILFTQDNSNVKVNFHKVESGADSFDAWGLTSYFLSLGSSGIKILKKNGIEGGGVEEKIKNLLVKMEEKNLIHGMGDFYRISKNIP